MSYCTIEEAWGSNFGERTKRQTSGRKDKKLQSSNKYRSIKHLDNFPIFTQNVFSETNDAKMGNNSYNRNSRKMKPKNCVVNREQYDNMDEEIEPPVQTEMQNNYNYDSEADEEYSAEEFNYLKTPIMNQESEMKYNKLNEEVNNKLGEEEYEYEYEYEEELKPINKVKNTEEVRNKIKERNEPNRYHNNSEEEYRTSMDDYNYKLDIFLYIFSGIILIFIMDTFVRIGMTINSRRTLRPPAPEYILTNVNTNSSNTR